jgi:hypothetical protein
LTNQDLQGKSKPWYLALAVPPKLASEEEILAACGEAIRLAPAEFPPNLPPSKELFGAPEWYPFENQAWPIGESIRQAFVRDPRLDGVSVCVANFGCLMTLARREKLILAKARTGPPERIV